MRLDRIDKEEDVLVDILQCQEQPELNDMSLACRTVDVSEYGMRLGSDVAIPVKSRLALRLDVNSKVYRLEGEVRWARQDEQYYIGLLLDEASPDFDAWMKMFQLDF